MVGIDGASSSSAIMAAVAATMSPTGSIAATTTTPHKRLEATAVTMIDTTTTTSSAPAAVVYAGSAVDAAAAATGGASGEATAEDRPFAHLGGGSAPSSPELKSPPLNGLSSKFKNTTNLSSLFHHSDTNQSVDSKYVRNTIPLHPPTLDTYQMLILRYLTSMGEYQEVRFCLFFSAFSVLLMFFSSHSFLVKCLSIMRCN